MDGFGYCEIFKYDAWFKHGTVGTFGAELRDFGTESDEHAEHVHVVVFSTTACMLI